MEPDTAEVNDQQDDPRRPCPRRSLRTSRKILFASIAVVMAFLFCEAGVRVRAWIRFGATTNDAVDTMIRHDVELGLRTPTPGYQRKGKHINVSINSLGFRGKEFKFEKSLGVVRVVCLGASTTFCGEVTTEDAAWPYQLQQLLREKYGTNIEVINAGVPGYTVDCSYKNLVHRVLPLDPDVIILYHANNDMAADTRKLASEQGIESRRNGGKTISFLTRYSMLVDLVYKNLKIQSGGSGEKLHSIPPDLASGFVEELEKIHDVAVENNIELVLSTFLTKYRREQDSQVQVKNADVAFFYMPWMTIDLLHDALGLYNAAIVSFADSRDIPVVRETSSIPADATHFVDCMHLADVGCQRMADRFGTFLIENSIIANKLEAETGSSSEK